VSVPSELRHSVRVALATTGTFVALLTSAAARAQEGTGAAVDSILVESSTCSHVLLDQVRRFSQIELKNANLPEGARSPRVILSCSEHVSLMRAFVAGREATRQIDLGKTEQPVRARVIALAIAELVRDTARGEGIEAPPITFESVAAPPAEAPSPPPQYLAVNHLVTFAKIETFGAQFRPLAGGGLGFSHDVGPLSLGLGPSIAVGERSFALGSVRSLVADLSVRLALRFSGFGHAAEIGAGHALGLVQLSGTATSDRVMAASATGVWAAPFLFGKFDVQLSDPVFLEVAAQLGVVTFPVRGRVERGSDVAIDGVWSGLSLGFGLDL